jgi:hypothetical protein
LCHLAAKRGRPLSEHPEKSDGFRIIKCTGVVVKRGKQLSGHYQKVTIRFLSG